MRGKYLQNARFMRWYEAHELMDDVICVHKDFSLSCSSKNQITTREMMMKKLIFLGDFAAGGLIEVFLFNARSSWLGFWRWLYGLK